MKDVLWEGRFVEEDVLYRRTFCIGGCFVEGCFVEGRFVEGCLVKGCFVGRTFWSEGHFVEGRFVIAPKISSIVLQFFRWAFGGIETF